MKIITKYDSNINVMWVNALLILLSRADDNDGEYRKNIYMMKYNRANLKHMHGSLITFNGTVGNEQKHLSFILDSPPPPPPPPSYSHALSHHH